MSARILVVDDERAIGIAIRRLLGARGHDVETTQSAEEAVQRLGREPVDLVISDLSLRGMGGLDLLRWIREHAPETGVVMITAYGSERTAVDAMKLGAADYLPKPFDNDELELVVERVLEGQTLRRDLRRLQDQVTGAYRFDAIVGKSAAMQRVFDVIRKVADTDLTVLIRGPSGTGKELVANAIHHHSPRRRKPFVKVNCAAFARELVESELFGHERGAFTGAAAARAGKFEAADGGTLLLDEVGDMPLETQAKILRALQEREVERVGGNRTLRVDVRVLAATNQDLEARVRDGTFREDLYYRLNVVTIDLPPLRERPEDLPPLVERFLAQASERLARPPKPLAADAYRAMLAHPWRGNVRELEHAIEQAVALASGPEIGLDDLPAAIRAGAAQPRADAGASGTGTPGTGALPTGVPGAPPEPGAAADEPATFREAKQAVVERFEREFLRRALVRTHGNIARAAEEVGMYRQQLQQKLAELGIDPEPFRRRGDG